MLVFPGEVMLSSLTSLSFVLQLFRDPLPPFSIFFSTHSLSLSLVQANTVKQAPSLTAYLCLLLSSAPTLAQKKVRLGQPRRGNQAGPAEREREREREREAESDEQMQIGVTNGGGGGALAVCKLDDEKEGGKEGRKEGRKEVERKRRGGGQISAALVWIWRRGSSQSHFSSSLLSSPIPPCPPRGEGERGHCIHGNGRAAVGSGEGVGWGTVVLLSSFSFSSQKTGGENVSNSGLFRTWQVMKGRTFGPVVVSHGKQL